jgi:ATP-dependent protease ClpP protease subunit
MKKLLNFESPADIRALVSEKIMAEYNPSIRAAESDTGATISIYETIGEDIFNGGGMTAKRIAGALRSIGNKPIEVNINSVGGNVFEGIAIYNLLAQHSEKVTVNIVGIAASAASIIAMAGDEIFVGTGAKIMIHNAWTIAMGDKNEFAKMSDTLSKVDAGLNDIYQSKTGLDAKSISKMMDSETWIGADEAIDNGFANGKMEKAIVESTTTQARVDNQIINAVKEIIPDATNAQARALKAKLKSFGIVGDAKDDIEGDVNNQVAMHEVQALILKLKMAS